MGETDNGGLFFDNDFMPFNEKTCFLGKTIEPRPKFDISGGAGNIMNYFCTRN